MILRISRHTFLSLTAAAVALMLTACSEQVTTGGGDTASVLKVSPPAFLNARAVVPENLNLDVRINNEPVVMVQSGEVWTGETTVLENSDLTLRVEWTEAFAGENLLLAVAQRTEENITNSYEFIVEDSSYVTTGEDFDADSDNISNLTERRQETDPFDENSPGTVDEVAPMAVIPASSKENVIDAQFNSVFWNNAQFNDVEGETLRIDNLIVDEPGNMVTGSPNYQWAGIHDGEYLTIFIFSKGISPPAINATRDSGTEVFNDDSIEIFWDGNLSRLTDYDSEDDMHIMIPLVRGTGATATANKSGETNTEIERGANVNPVVPFDVNNVEFATCLCVGERVTWEIRINLAEAQIPIGKTFGFEIQINQDDNGGMRDSKWAWALPERADGDTNVQSDLTWRFPNTMGLIQLDPFPGQ